MIFQAVPEAILLDPLPEFRTGDQCELMYRDELSPVGWPKGCRMDRKLTRAHGRRGVSGLSSTMRKDQWSED